jgi:peptidoglycan hydrolase-like protein with peptidoglycan-binding domain
VPTDELSDPGRCLDSQRRSQARRLAALRARRRGRWGRTALTVVALSLTVASGGALAATSGGAVAPGVAQIQGALGIPADGVMGPQTRRALKHFQRTHGLKADGKAGPATLTALGLGVTQQNRTVASATPTPTPAPADATAALAKIAQCESGGDPTAVSADGVYRGKYQFTRATWRDMGGSGDPAAADEATQDAMAAKLYAARGTAPWPVCAH